jgi:hypothetical protein
MKTGSDIWPILVVAVMAGSCVAQNPTSESADPPENLEVTLGPAFVGKLVGAFDLDDDGTDELFRLRRPIRHAHPTSTVWS